MSQRVVWGAPVTNPLLLTKERVRELRQLCHPDRHDNSKLSVRVMVWLDQASKELDKRAV